MSGGAWNKWEIAALIRLYPTGGYRACQEVLPTRTKPAIGAKAYDLGINAGHIKRPPRIQAHRDNPNTKPRADSQPAFTRRKCLKCRHLFTSEGPGNRICRPCKSGESWKSGGMNVGVWA